MLQSIAQRQVETGGITESNAFTIKANAKAFKVLIDGLYSNKIKSIIRELWTNAYDAHIMAGTQDRPFTCQLPTMLDPVFSVRDYGISLNHDQVMHLYTTVFESTKDQSNDQVGQLGLGSKSPFAYTDTFSVSAYLDGTKRMYSAYIDAGGVPTIALLGECETDEGNGLEVSFPVAEKDIDAFKTYATDVAWGFDVMPKIIGNEIVSPRIIQEQYSGVGWRIYKYNDMLSLGGRMYARQGCVLYPLDSAAIQHPNSIVHDILRNCTGIIDFPIGSLEIAASREGLGYDAQTIQNIRDRLDVVIDELFMCFDSYVSEMKTVWDMKRFNLRHDFEALPRDIADSLKERLTYKGKKITNYLPMFNPSVYDKQTRKVRPVLDIPVSRRTASEIYRTKHLTFRQADRSMSFNFNSAALIFFMDPTAKVKHEPWKMRRLYDTMRSQKEHKLLTAEVMPTGGDVYMFKVRRDSRQFKKLMIMLGRPTPQQLNMVWTDEIEELPESVRASVARRPAQLKVFKTSSNIIREENINVEDIKFYVPMFKDDIEFTNLHGDNVFWSIKTLQDTFRHVYNLSWTNETQIVGIPASRKAILNKLPEGAVNFVEWAREQALKRVSVEEIEYEYMLCEAVNEMHSDMWHSMNEWLGRRIEAFTEDSLVRQALEFRVDVLRAHEDLIKSKWVAKHAVYKNTVGYYNGKDVQRRVESELE